MRINLKIPNGTDQMYTICRSEKKKFATPYNILIETKYCCKYNRNKKSENVIIPGRVIRFFRNSSLIFSLPESSAQLQNSKISQCEYLLDKIYPLTRCRNRFPFWRQLFAV